MIGVVRRARRFWRRARRAVQFGRHAYWRRRPIRTGTVLYESFSGNGMLDNPEAIFRALLGLPEFAGLEHVWVLAGRARCRAAAREFRGIRGVRFVRYRSAGYFRALATSQYLINNATFPPEFGKRPGQVYLNTWHGTPLKRMGYDMPGGAMEAANTLRNFVAADYLLAQNPFMATTMYEDAYRLRNAFEGLIIEEGYPRVDRQRLREDDFLRTRERLEAAGVALGGRDIILYAPTWKGTSFANPENDIENLVATVAELQRRLGDDHVVLLKTHQIAHRYAAGNPALRGVLVPNEIPTNVVLGAASALVTDYSSIFFDYLATGRPIAFYTPDMTDYSDVRGFYQPPSTWPGPVSRTVSQLTRDLRAALAPGAAPHRRYAEWQRGYTPFDDGDATTRVIDIVFRGNRNGYRVRGATRDERTRILFYLGGMRSNGITTSALNLLNAIDHTRYDVSVVYAHRRRGQPAANQTRIPGSVRQFPRVGGMNGSKLAQLKRKWHERREDPSPTREPEFDAALWRDEWARCFGDVRFDIAVDFSGYSPFWSSLLLHGTASRTMIWLHNDMVAELDRTVKGVRTLRKGLVGVFAHYRHFDALVSVSPRLNEVNRRRLAGYAPPERFRSVRNLIDADHVLDRAAQPLLQLTEHPREEETGIVLPPDWARRLHRRGGTFWFVTVGRLSPEKNQSRLLHAFALVHRAHPNTGLLIVGNGPLRDQLQREIEQLGLTDAACLTGAYGNPFAIMAAADCFVLSSNYEGQPMVLLEAAVLGMPIVSVAFDSVHDAVPDDSILVTEQSAPALAAGMTAALEGRVAVSRLEAEDYLAAVRDELHDAAGAAAVAVDDEAA